MANTLLEEAKKIVSLKAHKPPTDEEIELTLAWLKEEISLTQAGKVIQKRRGLKHGMGVYVLFARSLKELYRRGKIKLIK